MKNNATPPRLFQRLFRWFCRRDIRSHIEGDLLELYQERVKTNGRRKADIQFIIDVLQLMRPGIIRSIKPHYHINQYRYSMFKNHLKSGWRNLMHQKTFTAINIIGLSIGICAALIIFLVVQYDFSFDKFEKDNNRIYRVVEKYTLKVSGKNYGGSAMPDPLPTAVANEVTGLDAVVALTRGNTAKVSVPTQHTDKKTLFNNQEKIVFTNDNYFKLVGYDWLAGNAVTALQQPYTAVLTASNARLYFPTLTAGEVIGKELFFDDSIRITITGVVKDITENTIFNYKTFLSRITLETTSLKPRFWDRWNHEQQSLLFIKLAPGITTANINNQINKLFAKYNKPNYEDPEIRTLDLQPLRDIHFKGYYDSSSSGLADKSILNGLQAIAAFLLLLACINFINLTTAKASGRAKEIGIRKTMGSSRFQLVMQFMGETFLLTVIATVLSAVSVPLLLKAFASFIPQGVKFNIIRQPGVLVFLLLLILAVTILAGFYPAIMLSSYKPVSVLKNQANAATGISRKAWLRKGLTVSQFVIAQVFIIGTLLVSKQINYSLNRNIGMKKDAVLYFGNYTDTFSSRKMVLLNKLKAIPGIEMASLSMDPPSSSSSWMDVMKYEDSKKVIETNVQVKIGDSNYIKLYHIRLLAGGNIINNNTMGDLLINETYLHALGFTDPHDIIGRYINVYGKKRVAGVVQDFNQKSLHETITPLLITGGIESESTFNIALKPQSAGGITWKKTIQQMQQAWKEVYPDKDFDYSFLDDAIASYYTAEQNISTLLMWSTWLTIFISCLGLFGLVIYITNQRTKEIGIRKVVGATVAQLVTLMSKDFLKLVVIAFAIAVPFAWWGTNTWLQSFAYRTTLSWWVFALGGVIMLLLAFAILSVRIIKAANANLVKALRTE